MKSAFLAFASIVGLYCGLASQPLGAQTKPEALEPGTPVEGSVSPQEVQRYSIAVTQGQYLRILLDPKGAGLRTRLAGPDQATLAETQESEGDSDPVTLLAMAPASGVCTLEIRLRESSPGRAGYRARIADLRSSTPEDQKRVAAFRADSEGDRFRAAGTAEGRRQAIDRYETALPSWQASQDAEGEASTLAKLGDLTYVMGDRVKSLQYRLREVPLRKASGDRRLEARALRSVGSVYLNLGQPAKALELLASALEIQKELGDRPGQADTLNTQAFFYYSTGEPRKALELLEEALPLRHLSLDRSGEAYSLHSIGTIYLSMAEQQKALEYFDQALPLWRAAANRIGEATTLNNMAMVYSALGRSQQALEVLNQTLAIQLATGNRPGEATVYNNFAHVYSLMGQAGKAVEYLTRALALDRAVSDRNGEAMILANMGTAYRLLGDQRKALEYQAQGLAIQRETKDRLGEGISLNSMGWTYRAAGEWQKALESYEQALPLLRANGDRRQEGGVLTGLASVYVSLGQQEKAFEYAGQARTLLHSIGAGLEESSALYLLARVERARNHTEEARQRITEALDLAESVRQNVAAEELRSSYFATIREQFELYVDLLMSLHREHPGAGFDAQALQLSERARARSLLDLLAESQADLRQGVDPALLEEERSVEALLSAKAVRQMQMLAGKHTLDQAGAAEKEIRDLSGRYSQVRAEIRARSPHYAALTQPRSLTVAEIQRETLDQRTVLLEYWLGEERSFLWEIGAGSLRSYELPKRAVVEAAAREAYTALSTPGAAPGKKLAAVSRMLIGPIAEGLGNKRLLIVSEGALQFLPFSSLLDPRNGQPLLAGHEVVNLPSASTLAVLRGELAGRKPAPLTVAVLADPVFRADDSRITGAHDNAGGLPEQIQRSAGEAGLQDLVRLRGSRREAEWISSLAPAASALQALDFRASRATATGGELGRYRIIHFATHALLNSQHPELSGLVLSLVDERGRPQNGFLQAHEIYNLKLNADLVVLSACQTALGQEVRSEGIVGITRGFMYAGAPRVVASLWKVPDQATAELMKRFYEGMLTRKLPAAAALRQAQLALSKEPDYEHPYYWAGFTLQGEWK